VDEHDQERPMTPTQSEKALAFRALHEKPGAFVIPNPWDAGSARILASLGFKALATTSKGHAYTLGRLDGDVSRDEALAKTRDLAVRDGAAWSVMIGSGETYLTPYALELQATNLQTGLIEWTDSKEIVRESSRPFIGW